LVFAPERLLHSNSTTFVGGKERSLYVARASRGLELHREQALEAFDQRAEQLGVLRYRRQRMLLNRGTVIIVVGDRYARVRIAN
jgi:hypothetical protein